VTSRRRRHRIKITGFTVTGKYSQYLGTTRKVPPPNTGRLSVGVKGVPPEPMGFEAFDVK
jgi:hypothetical protein